MIYVRAVDGQTASSDLEVLIVEVANVANIRLESQNGLFVDDLFVPDEFSFERILACVLNFDVSHGICSPVEIKELLIVKEFVFVL